MSEDEEALIRRAMGALGRRKTEKKAAASAENGKKGGRPRKIKPEPEKDEQQSEQEQGA